MKAPALLSSAVGGLVLTLALAAHARAATVVLDAIQDTSMYSESETTSNGCGEYLFSGFTNGGLTRRGLIMFDVAGAVPGGSTVTSVTLNLHVSRNPPGSFSSPFGLHRMSADWGESQPPGACSDAGAPGGTGISAEAPDATWRYAMYDTTSPTEWTNGNNGADGDYVVAASTTATAGGSGSTTSWSGAGLVADVDYWIANPAQNFGWIIKGDETTFRSARRFDTRENSNASFHPKLTIVYDAGPTPPDVTVIAPNGGETVTANTSTTVQWSASDESGIAYVDLYVSDDGGTSFLPVALTLANTGSHTWFPANRPSTQSIFRVIATDTTLVTNFDDSDAVFTVASPVGGTVPTTLRDFDQPGTQPLDPDATAIIDPSDCAVCHSGYGEQGVEPSFNWQGSMMAHASIDPLFEACLAIANQDAPDSGDLCLRCHLSSGWLEALSVPTDGSEMLASDQIGVSCNFCHRMVDPIPDAANPVEDTAILAALADAPTEFGTGMYVIDPDDNRRGPFVDATSGHPILVSPFHQEAALCGTCHDVSNPAFEKDGMGNYVPNAFDTPASDFSPHTIMPIERTYSEWLASEYNTPAGVYAPQFGGNKDFVSTCQDCHMRDVTGHGCSLPAAPLRTDLPLHDLTGGSAWMIGVLSTLYPAQVPPAAAAAGAARSRDLLSKAATLEAERDGSDLKVTVTNETGHKLPTGYPEGRRIWINVRFLDDGMNPVSESGAYDVSTGVLTHDAAIRIYETEPGTDGIPGLADGTLFHFVLNNKVYKDNRIPPRGFTNAAYDLFGAAPVGAAYPDGQYWDDTLYAIPAGATSAEVTLYYQSTTKEYVEFLRDENVTDTKGQDMYDIWNNNGKCPPEQMAQVIVALPPCPWDFTGVGATPDGNVGLADLTQLLNNWGPCPGAPDPCPWDLTGAGDMPDGFVGTADLTYLLNNWGPCP